MAAHRARGRRRGDGMTAPTVPSHPGLKDGPVYLDYNATTPVDPRVVEAMLLYLATEFGNPGSGHAYAGRPRTALAEARAQVATLIGADPDEIVFAGGGSEADTLALFGTVLARLAAGSESGPMQVIIQATEHPAVLEACHALDRRHGVHITVLPVDRDGMVDPADLADVIGDRTVLVSVMTANNETGVIQPIRELADIAHAHGALLHTDAPQAADKIALDVRDLGVDLLTVAGHKLYAPKGVGALYVRRGVNLEPVIPGGGQERGLRAGTENVAAAVALGAAAQLAAADLAIGGAARMAGLRDELHHHLARLLPGRIHLNGHPTRRLPNTLNISIDGTRGDALLAAASGIAAATGSACHTGDPTPSPVLTAMGYSPERALAALRLSLGRWSTSAEIQAAAEHIAKAAGSA